VSAFVRGVGEQQGAGEHLKIGQGVACGTKREIVKDWLWLSLLYACAYAGRIRRTSHVDTRSCTWTVLDFTCLWQATRNAWVTAATRTRDLEVQSDGNHRTVRMGNELMKGYRITARRNFFWRSNSWEIPVRRSVSTTALKSSNKVPIRINTMLIKKLRSILFDSNDWIIGGHLTLTSLISLHGVPHHIFLYQLTKP